MLAIPQPKFHVELFGPIVYYKRDGAGNVGGGGGCSSGGGGGLSCCCGICHEQHYQCVQCFWTLGINTIILIKP
jgi:hypothetical protein